MKVLLLNGSPHQQGCTYTALTEVAAALGQAGVESEIIQVGAEPVHGCTSCGYCSSSAGRCVFDDRLNQVLAQLDQIDGLVIGSPVYYASASGQICAFCDRLFIAGGEKLRYKPGAAVVSARRAGTTAALDRLNKYFTINRMPVVSSQYWNMVHGNTPEQVRQDEEGMQTMRELGRNLAWLLSCIEAGRAAGFPPPEPEPRIKTSFIR